MFHDFDINEDEFTYYGHGNIADLEEYEVILDKDKMRDSLRDELIYRGDGGLSRVVDMTATQFQEFVVGTVHEGFLRGYGYAVHNDAFLTDEERHVFHEELRKEAYGTLRVWWYNSEDSSHCLDGGKYDSLAEAIAAVPDFFRELLAQCSEDEQRERIIAGYFAVESENLGAVEYVSVPALGPARN